MKKLNSIFNDPEFPLKRLIVGVLLGISPAWMTKEPSIILITGVISFFLGVIPMSIAFYKNKKHKNAISWIAFFAMWFPAGILTFTISVIWALFDTPMKK